jgi:hypothetical protein
VLFGCYGMYSEVSGVNLVIRHMPLITAFSLRIIRVTLLSQSEIMWPSLTQLMDPRISMLHCRSVVYSASTKCRLEALTLLIESTCSSKLAALWWHLDTVSIRKSTVLNAPSLPFVCVSPRLQCYYSSGPHTREWSRRFHTGS